MKPICYLFPPFFSFISYALCWCPLIGDQISSRSPLSRGFSESESEKALLDRPGNNPQMIKSFTYAWFNFTCYHPPRATPGTSPTLRSRGWGIVWSRLVPGGGGWGKLNITSCCSSEVRHFSVDAGPRGEDCLFPVRISRICSRFVREE